MILISKYIFPSFICHEMNYYIMYVWLWKKTTCCKTREVERVKKKFTFSQTRKSWHERTLHLRKDTQRKESSGNTNKRAGRLVMVVEGKAEQRRMLMQTPWHLLMNVFMHVVYLVSCQSSSHTHIYTNTQYSLQQQCLSKAINYQCTSHLSLSSSPPEIHHHHHDHRVCSFV